MNCPHCKHPGAEGRNYCGACGAPLVQYCRLCGFRNLADDRYCGGCGSPCAEGAPRQEPRTQPVRPVAPAPPAAPVAPVPQGAPGPVNPAMADLLEAARETEEVGQQDADVKVSQNDIDSLFGD